VNKNTYKVDYSRLTYCLS